MDNKRIKTMEVIRNEEKTEIIGFIINGKEQWARENEDTKDLFDRLYQIYGNNLVKALQKGNHKIYTMVEYKKAKRIEETKPSLKKKIAATTVVAVMAITGAYYGIPFVKAKLATDNATAKATTEQQYKITDNVELEKVYTELLEYETGTEIVADLKKINKIMGKINSIAVENPDEKGKISFIKSEEIAALMDIYNANNTHLTLHEDENTLRCDYLEGQASLINLSQGSRDVQEIDKVFETKSLKTKQQGIQIETQETLDNNNIATKNFIDMLNDNYGTRGSNPELQAEVAFGQPGLAAALTDELSGETLENYQVASKTETGQLNELVQIAGKDSKRAAVENNKINIEKQQKIDKALKIMNESVKNYDRTDFDPSTTEKGKDMIVAMMGNIGITADGSYVIINKTTHSTERISRDEAVNRFGEGAVEDLERTAPVDTDGDGRNDTPLDEANRDSEEQGQKDAADYSKGFTAGQKAFTNGGPSTASSGSSAYKNGYQAGYQYAKNLYEEQKKKDPKPKDEWTPANPEPKPITPAPSPEPEKPPVFDEWTDEIQTQNIKQQVIKIETTDGVQLESKIPVRVRA